MNDITFDSSSEKLASVSKATAGRLPRTVIVAAKPGGMGKTTTSQILVHLLRQEGFEFDVFSIDASNTLAASKLKLLVPETVDLSFGASIAEIAKNPTSALDHFETMGERPRRHCIH